MTKISLTMLTIGSLGIGGSITSSDAQNKNDPAPPRLTQPIVADCEGNNATLNVTHQTAAALGINSLIIAIARLGDGEQSRNLNRRRIHNIRVFLIEFWKRSPETIITAEGERVKGYGRVELYVGGKLFDTMAVRTDKDLMVGSCEPDNIRPKWQDRNLYPYRDRKPRKKKVGSGLRFS